MEAAVRCCLADDMVGSSVGNVLLAVHQILDLARRRQLSVALPHSRKPGNASSTKK